MKPPPCPGLRAPSMWLLSTEAPFPELGPVAAVVWDAEASVESGPRALGPLDHSVHV